jgi:hypothetical protein
MWQNWSLRNTTSLGACEVDVLQVFCPVPHAVFTKLPFYQDLNTKTSWCFNPLPRLISTLYRDLFSTLYNYRFYPLPRLVYWDLFLPFTETCFYPLAQPLPRLVCTLYRDLFLPFTETCFYPLAQPLPRLVCTLYWDLFLPFTETCFYLLPRLVSTLYLDLFLPFT